MRTTFKILIAVAVIGTGFGVYWWAQPAIHLGVSKVVPTGPAATRPAEMQSPLSVLNSDSVWVVQYDNQGRRSYQFKADQYLPQGGDNVNVTKPRTVFFLKGGRGRSRLELDGDSGNIVVDNAPDAPKNGVMKKDSVGHGAMQPPRKGKLHNVIVRLYEDEYADPKNPSLVMHTNNVAFDNETFRIFTEGYTDTATGEKIAADWVKVKVEGQYDFVGYGLTIRWNDLDQRLELLRIQHGESLTLNDPSVLRGTTFGAKHTAVSTAADEVDTEIAREIAGPPAPVLPMTPAIAINPDVILVEDSPAKVKKGKKDKTARNGDAPRPATKAATSKPVKPAQPPYHAVFNQDVVVKQGDQTVAVADIMNVDFLMDSGKRATTQPSSRPSTAPSTKPTVASAATAAPEPAFSPASVEAPSVATTASTAPSTTQSVIATTKPSDDQKITVYWHGPLIITPATVPAELALTPGETVLQFVGEPAVLTREGSEAKCATATYRSLDGRMELRNSEQFPKVLITQAPKDPTAPPATISTDWVEYSMLTKVATLHGASEAQIPIVDAALADATTQPTKPADANRMMIARWSDWAAFHLSGESENQMSIERADFAGDVDIQHPQMKLKSQRLELAFDPSGAMHNVAQSPDAMSSNSNVNLKRAIATQSVWCELTDTKGKKQTILCDRLDLKTALSEDGRMYPEIVDASGAVKASDETQELSAGHVVLTLAPTEKPAQAAALAADAVADADNQTPVPAPTPSSLIPGGGGIELRTMVATDAVSVKSADGATAVGDSLNVSAEPGITGRTTVVLVGAPARVVDASENVITGPKIIIHPKESVATIEGAGTMDATQGADAGKPAARPAGENAKAGRPLHVSWNDSAIVNGPRNRIEASGKVSASTPDPDGTINTARGERVVVVMVDKLPPAGTTQPIGAATQKPAPTATSQPAGDATAGGQFKMDLFKDKEVGSVVLLDKDRAIINSNLKAADGTLLRETQLQATSMRFQPRDGQMLIPVPGEMIVRDHRVEEKPAAGNAPAKAGTETTGRGDTAFKWAKSLAYDQTKRRAVMAGDVLIVHKPEAQKQAATQPATKGAAPANPADPVRVNADWVAADFEPADSNTTKPTAVPEGGAADPSALRLKALTAIGNITITRSTGQMLAQKIVFNPQTGWITATGTANNPASYTDLTTGQTTSAAEIWWNSNTWDVRFKNISARAGK